MVEVLIKKFTYLAKHSPSSFIGNASFSLNLFSGNTASGRSYSIDSLKPDSKRCTGLVKYGVSQRGYLVSAIIALINWSPVNFMVFSNLIANRAMNTIGIAMVLNPLKTGLVIWELLVEIFSSKFIHLCIPLYNYIITQEIHDVKG